MDITGLFKKEYIIGLDIGSSSVKIAQFIRKEDGLHLAKADMKEIDEEGQIVLALKDLFRGIDVKKSEVIAVINCPKTAIKIAKTPYMPKAELRDGISLEAKNYFPFPIDGSSLDYEILGDVVEKGVRKYEVAVAVSPNTTVERYLSLLEKAGIKPTSFVPLPYAVQKLAEHLYAFAESGKKDARVYLVIGRFYTEFAILKGRELVFNRKIPVAGEDFTKAMTAVLVSDKGKTELTIDEAEKIKREVGIPAEANSRVINDKISATQILSMLRAPLEQLISEIERCFDYYREESGGGKMIHLLYLAGELLLAGLSSSFRRA